MKSKRVGGAVVAVVMLVAGGCASSSVRTPPPRSPSLVISPLQRILVAGFVADDNGLNVDLNTETARILRTELRRQGALGVIQTDPVTLRTDTAFGDTAYWQAIGEEYGSPLIVTGVVKLTRAAPNVRQRGGGAAVYAIEPGFLLETTIVLVDGATGRVLSSEQLPRKSRYGAGRSATPALMYSAMMQSLTPDLLRAVLRDRPVSSVNGRRSST